MEMKTQTVLTKTMITTNTITYMYIDTEKWITTVYSFKIIVFYGKLTKVIIIVLTTTSIFYS